MHECKSSKNKKNGIAIENECKSDESHAWMANGISQAHHHNTFHFFYEPLKAAVDNDDIF